MVPAPLLIGVPATNTSPESKSFTVTLKGPGPAAALSISIVKKPVATRAGSVVFLGRQVVY